MLVVHTITDYNYAPVFMTLCHYIASAVEADSINIRKLKVTRPNYDRYLVILFKSLTKILAAGALIASVALPQTHVYYCRVPCPLSRNLSRVMA